MTDELSEQHALIEAVSASKTLGSKTLWQDFSFKAYPREVVAITGASGAGKTTLLSCIGLLERVDDGKVLLDQTDVTQISERRRRGWYRSEVGFLFQFHGLISNWTVRQNLQIAQAFHPRHLAAKNKAIDRVLVELGLFDVSKRKVWTLSGGEQQRVALGRLLLRKPRIILVDEPTSSLDTDNATTVMTVLRKLADSGSCVVVSTHDPNVIDWADRRIEIARSLPA